MPSRRLIAEEINTANSLLVEVRDRLNQLSAGDPILLFALRRRLFVALTYDERGKPPQRRKLQIQKWTQQKGICAECDGEMIRAYSELDRIDPVLGYTVENTELLHAKCHHGRQAAKRYT